MLEFVMENGGTIAVALVLAGLVAFVLRGMLRDKRRGKLSCGGNCAACGGHCGKSV